MSKWLDVLEPDEIDCEQCEYYDREEERRSAWVCNPFDCGTLPCEVEDDREEFA